MLVNQKSKTFSAARANDVMANPLFTPGYVTKIGVLPAGFGCSLNVVKSLMPQSSLALKHYLEATYGPTARARVLAWDWETIDVLWFDRLPSHVLAHCSIEESMVPRAAATMRKSTARNSSMAQLAGLDAFYALLQGPVFKKFSDTRLLWRFRREDSCAGKFLHQGGSRSRRETAREGGWVEVTHVQEKLALDKSYGNPGTRHALGLYFHRARGSGLWFRRGVTQTRDDTYQHMHCELARSRCDDNSSDWDLSVMKDLAGQVCDHQFTASLRVTSVGSCHCCVSLSLSE